VLRRMFNIAVARSCFQPTLVRGWNFGHREGIVRPHYVSLDGAEKDRVSRPGISAQYRADHYGNGVARLIRN